MFFITQKRKIKLVQSIENIIEISRRKVVNNINHTIVQTYWHIGRLIVTHENHGENKAIYGKALLKELSEELTSKYGKGYSISNLQSMRKFYLEYQIQQTVSVKFKDFPSNQKLLSWSHYLFLMTIDNKEERNFDEVESLNNNWSIRELKWQYDSSLFERIALSKNKEQIIELSKKGQIIEKPIDLVKDPFVLEFLNLKEHNTYTESILEQEIINNLSLFLLEIGRGFSFVKRQYRITIDNDHYYIDLVFYNRLLKCFVLLDLKIGLLKHQDIGQMQIYVNYFDRKVKTNEENKTIGILLCKNKNESLVKMTLPTDNEQIFASKYQTVLPSKEQLQLLLRENNEDVICENNFHNKILNIISKNKNISQKKLAKLLNVSESKIYRSIKYLKENNYIEYIGADKNEYWNIKRKY